MQCFKPLIAYKTRDGITFNPAKGFSDLPLKLRCGQCIGCRLHKSKEWAIRCVEEMRMHEENCFITLTFDDTKLQNELQNYTLIKSDFQNFMKRLRKNTGAKIRYFHCGEYGEKFSRPHHHAIIFGYDFKDKKEARKSKLGHPQFTSETLTKAWQDQGDAFVSEANFDTAAYVARYSTKLYNKTKGSPEHYPTQDEYYQGRTPEYATMSRRPGIGHKYFEKYKDEIYRDDYIIINNKKMKPPTYYDNLLEKVSENVLKDIKAQRFKIAKEQSDFENIDRMHAKELCRELELKQWNRSL
jgi:hypothetical protein